MSVRELISMVDKAITHYGTTNNIKECAYILTNGKMLDFSGFRFGGSKGYRSMDHREIVDIYDEDIDRYDAMNDFMNQGNIRTTPENGGLDISQIITLTKQQKLSLRNYINYFYGEIVLDISDRNGKNVYNFQYDKKTASSRILNDIEEHLVSL